MDDNHSSTLGLHYRHERLPDASSYTRLLTTKPHDGDDSYTLGYELTTWHIDATPTFYAISYSWGDPGQTALIGVNGRPMTMTQNCEIALCQANQCTPEHSERQNFTRTSGRCYYWCDAVCIDQRNQAEKEAQVAAIGRIYRRAKQVLTCLGAPIEGTDSPFLFRKLRCRSRQLGRIGEYWLPRGEFHVDVARLTDVKWTRMVTFFLLSMSRRTIIRLCRALERLLGSPYFQRTWICQELFLGRSVSVCCGSQCVPISAIYGLAQASAFLSSSWSIKPLDCVWSLLHPLTSQQQLRQYNCGRTKYFLWLLSTGSSPDPPTRSLGSLMWRIRYQECGDIRDKVYGTLSMVRWPDDEAIPVDYGRDPFDLAILVMAVIRKRPSGWDGRWYDVAESVARNLELGAHPSEKLAEQTRKRRLAMPTPTSIRMGSASSWEVAFTGSSQQYDFFWGYRLVKIDGQWALEWRSQPLPGLAKGRSVRIRTWNTDLRPRIGDKIFHDVKLHDLFLPPTTQPGDWCLMHSRCRPVFQLDSQFTAINHHLRMDRTVLIARERSHDSKHPSSIIGKGLIVSDMAYTILGHPVAAEFRVHLGDEDALVLATTTSMVNGSGAGGLAEPAGIAMWVSEKEASCYFNTPVCTNL